MPTERRLAGILFTDIVGYSALAERDEERALKARERIVEIVRERVAEHGGRVEEAWTDETASLFPTALRAASCAIAIQEALAGESILVLRTAVHVGDVGSADARDDSFLVAAALAHTAAPGGVRLSGRAYDDLEGRLRIAFSDLGPLALPRLSEPVRVYAVHVGAGPPEPVPAQPQPARHHLAAIFAADVVSYSRLMATEEDWTVRTMTRYRGVFADRIGEHGGRVIDTSGDGVLAEFGSALDAVRCAIAVQEDLRERNRPLPPERALRYRIGIHLGDVRAEGERIYGSGVNVAARLEAIAPAGGVCVSAPVHEQVRYQLDRPFVDLGERRLKNIPHAVRAWALAIDGSASRRGRRWRTAALAAGGALAVLALVLALAWRPLLGVALDRAGLTGPPVAPPLPDKPSIAVLPFENMSGEPEQEYFSDGLAEDLTTGLAKVPALFVISRNSAFTYKDRAVPVEEVGRELGVRYVLEGSVRRAGDRVRISAQLVDAATGFHLWSESYDRDLSDIFAVQSEIAQEILAALSIEIDQAEFLRIRATAPEDLTTYDLFMKGVFHATNFTRADTERARRLLEEAIERDPEYAEPWAVLGATYVTEYGLGWSRDPALMDRAHEYAQRALAIDPSAMSAYITLGAVHLFRGEAARAVEDLERVNDWNDNLDTAHMLLAGALLQEGRYLAALAEVNRALRLNPRQPTGSWVVMGFLNAMLGRDDEAVRLWERVVEANPDMLMARIALAGRDGADAAEARRHVLEILRVNPDLTAEQAISLMQGNVDVIGAADSRRVAANLRAAGLP